MDRFGANRCQRASSRVERRVDKVDNFDDFDVDGDELFLTYSMRMLGVLKQVHDLERVRRLSAGFCLQKCQFNGISWR